MIDKIIYQLQDIRAELIRDNPFGVLKGLDELIKYCEANRQGACMDCKYFNAQPACKVAEPCRHRSYPDFGANCPAAINKYDIDNSKCETIVNFCMNKVVIQEHKQRYALTIDWNISDIKKCYEAKDKT